ncbi:hypothetical protein VTJ49DRAFT_5929 [Mycothermus thermophilus]|uniref:Uncharacterized protein n=1 Tax=Humicola insolens TaxID=85995 RepID=A0ABR3VKZ2_HUMIN
MTSRPLDDVPPPPYSETDIYSSSARDTYAADDASQSTTSTNGDVIYTPPLTPRSSHHSNFAGEADDVAPSPAAAYFETRPAPPLSHLPFVVHTIALTESSTPDSLPYPADLAARDVRLEDWLTFVNYLLPHHSALSNEEVIDRKLRAEAMTAIRTSAAEGGNNTNHSNSNSNDNNNNDARSHSSGVTSHAEAQLNSIRSADGATPPAPNRQSVETTVREWNDGFFAPRRISIRVDLESVEEAGTAQSTSPELTHLPPQPLQQDGPPPMPGAWNTAFDQPSSTSPANSAEQNQSRSPDTDRPRRGLGSFFPFSSGSGSGSGRGGTGRGGFRFGGINIENDRVSIGDTFFADGRTGSVRIGGITADPTGIKINGQPLFNAPTFPLGGGHCGRGWGGRGGGGWGMGCHARRGGGPWGGSSRGGFWSGHGWHHPRSPGPSGHPGGHEHGHHGHARGFGGGGFSTGTDTGAEREDEPRGRSPHRDGDEKSPRPRSRSSSTSSSSSSLSSCSTSSLSSLDSDFDELRDAQLPVAKQHLEAWLSHPDQPVTKEQVRRLRDEMRAANRHPPPPYSAVASNREVITALRHEVRSLARSWKIIRKEQRRARRQLKKELRRAKRAEKKEYRRAKREMKRAAREAKREARRGGPPPPPPPHPPQPPQAPYHLHPFSPPNNDPTAPPPSYTSSPTQQGQPPPGGNQPYTYFNTPNPDPLVSGRYRAVWEAEARVAEKEEELMRLHKAIALAEFLGNDEAAAAAGSSSAGGGEKKPGTGSGVLKLEAEAKAVQRELEELVKELEMARIEADEEFAKELARQEESRGFEWN